MGLLDLFIGPIAGRHAPPSKSHRRRAGKAKAGMGLAELFSPVTQSRPKSSGEGGGGLLDHLLGPPSGSWVTNGFNDTKSPSGFKRGNRITVTSGPNGGKSGEVIHVNDQMGCLDVLFDGGVFTHAVPFRLASKG